MLEIPVIKSALDEMIQEELDGSLWRHIFFAQTTKSVLMEGFVDWDKECKVRTRYVWSYFGIVE